MGRSIHRAALAALLAATSVPLLASPALAHAEFVSSTPGPDATIAGSPGALVVTFSQDLDPSRTSLEVRDSSGATVARGGELGSGPREFRLALPQLPPGGYEVRWTSFSAEDGELARGSYAFTVVAVPASASPTATASTETGSGGTSGADAGVLLPIVAALVVAGVVGAWLLRRRSA